MNTTAASPHVLQSFVAGRWLGSQPAQALHSAIHGQEVAFAHAENLDSAEALQYGRTTGLRSLLAMDFQQRAAALRALAKYLGERKEELYAISAHTGATRVDSWIDIEGGTGTLFAYAGMAASELPSGNLIHEGPAAALGKKNTFAGTHILVPRGGVAVHINAFNFPVWGLLEKFAPTFLAGMPCIGKPATATSYLTEALVRMIDQSCILPKGALQLVIGSTGDLLDRLQEPDVVTFTGSADTAAKLRVNANLIQRSIPFNAEADSLNCAILADDVSPDDEEFDLFVKEVVREMTVKAGQKCTAIRRAIVPRKHLDAVAEKIKARLAKVVVGDPSLEGVKMGALASKAQQADVAERVAMLRQSAEVVFGADPHFKAVGQGTEQGAFFQPTLLLCQKPLSIDSVHDIEAFGPVCTLMPFDGMEEALALAQRGKGSLVATLVTQSPAVAAQMIPRMAAWHGRLHVLDRESAGESTGHGSPLPSLKHGGPGRAGGGEELGGIRAVRHLMQRAAVQGSPSMLSAITHEHVRGAKVIETGTHPFRRYFEELQIGESLRTGSKVIGQADVHAFGELTGDMFYMHFDDAAAKASVFGKRIAHGYLVLSDAAGLFVVAEPGPVLANYGLDTLRFVKPVGLGDSIQVRLTCKRKIDRHKKDANGQGQGVVAWDVEVTNQDQEVVASYDILTLVAKKG
ncbi:MAG: phenylacetic acid degradation bifunctional protein PaaZ [Betaproteobacteria bacterium]|nr:phenylacetic acid degradation bifunctional protein PaaZ [Betaproteobacteria bacterium]